MIALVFFLVGLFLVTLTLLVCYFCGNIIVRYLKEDDLSHWLIKTGLGMMFWLLFMAVAGICTAIGHAVLT